MSEFLRSYNVRTAPSLLNLAASQNLVKDTINPVSTRDTCGTEKRQNVDHIHLRVSDLKASEGFCKVIVEVLEIDGVNIQDGFFICDDPFDSPSEDYQSKVHLAFQADTRKIVDAFYNAALADCGQDNAKPGEREYHPGYYGAYVLDPDGNNIEAVYHGPAKRSTDAVTFTFAG